MDHLQQLPLSGEVIPHHHVPVKDTLKERFEIFGLSVAQVTGKSPGYRILIEKFQYF